MKNNDCLKKCFLILMLCYLQLMGCSPSSPNQRDYKYNERKIIEHFHNRKSGLPMDAFSFYITGSVNYAMEIEAESIVNLLKKCDYNKCYVGMAGPDTEMNKNIFKLVCDQYRALDKKDKTANVKMVYYGPENDRNEIGAYTKTCNLRMTYVVFFG